MSALKKLDVYLVEKPEPLIGAETIQLLLLREILDYTVLRTEETRELNSANTPLSESDRTTVTKRVAFLGSKQKAAESRQMEYLLRSAANGTGKDVPSGRQGEGCHLKDNLCLRCPRCGLYGASALGEEANIKHRIEYSTAFSLFPFEQIAEEITFNAVNEVDQKTGQALGSRNVVRPASLFPSIVTLKGVSREELVLTLKTLLACKSYGAESRIGGIAAIHSLGSWPAGRRLLPLWSSLWSFTTRKTDSILEPLNPFSIGSTKLWRVTRTGFWCLRLMRWINLSKNVRKSPLTGVFWTKPTTMLPSIGGRRGRKSRRCDEQTS